MTSSPDPSRNAVAAVAFPIAVPGIYDYLVPGGLRETIAPGMPVLVDLKNRRLWGVAVALKPGSAFSNLKPIIELRADRWTDRNSSLIELYRWMAAYYQCDLGRVFRPLVRKGSIGAGDKTVTVFRPAAGVQTELEGVPSLTPLQDRALASLQSLGEPLTKRELAERLGISSSVVTELLRKGFVLQEKKRIVRDPFAGEAPAKEVPVVLTDEQTTAVETIFAAASDPGRPFLLHGITGSGKTHVYTELSSRVLERGRGVIILVPEISLTPQTIQRFRAAVGDTVAVIHSRMSDGERADSSQALVTGSKRLVIGVRSAILAPIDDVGLIIVDEEHDGSYKQSDTEPRYHARDVAIMRGRFEKALVVLGSATPSIESYFNAQSGKYRLLQLKSRFGSARLPEVTIVDMNEERRENNWTILSRPLEYGMHRALDAGRQIILLLNRRGYSTILICKECGFTHRCTACSLPLRYHRHDGTLKCHCCGHEERAPDACPVCRGQQMKYQGTAIQKAEEVIGEKFPEARILRMDHDTTTRKGSHHAILSAFAERKAEILLGTQMVAKGLNFPGVSLVGVLQADTGLLFPDFRASERTFQLLTQVAGRAGRSDDAGEVVIQTGYPADPAILSSSKHDYEGFYESELPHRRELRYPPFAKLARIVLSGPQAVTLRAEMDRLAREIRRRSPEIALLGPAPAALEKVGNEFRFSLLLKSASPRTLSSLLAGIRADRKKGTEAGSKLIIDVDPQYML